MRRAPSLDSYHEFAHIETARAGVALDAGRLRTMAASHPHRSTTSCSASSITATPYPRSPHYRQTRYVGRTRREPHRSMRWRRPFVARRSRYPVGAAIAQKAFPAEAVAALARTLLRVES